MTVPCARRREHLRPGFRREEQLLEIGLRHFLKPSPLRNREKHCRFDAAPGHGLRPFPVELASRNSLNRALAS